MSATRIAGLGQIQTSHEAPLLCGYHMPLLLSRCYSVVVITRDFDHCELSSRNPGSNPGSTLVPLPAHFCVEIPNVHLAILMWIHTAKIRDEIVLRSTYVEYILVPTNPAPIITWP